MLSSAGKCLPCFTVTHYGNPLFDQLWWITLNLKPFREPAPTRKYERINFGDVGFIRYGQFHLLFSVGRPLGDRRLGTDFPASFEGFGYQNPGISPTSRPGIRNIACSVTAPLSVAAFGSLLTGLHIT